MAREESTWLPEPPIRTIGPSRLETYVSSPDERSSDGGWPALVFLHGNGESAGQKTMQQAFLENDSAHGPLRRVRRGLEQFLRPRFVIAAPQLPGSGGDIWANHAADIEELVSSLVGADAVDPGRITLCGFSYGANGVVRLFRLYHWHAIWVVDPPMLPPASPLPRMRLCRLGLGRYAMQNSAGWRDALPAETLRVAEYPEEHGRASWRDFGAEGSYEGLDE